MNNNSSKTIMDQIDHISNRVSTFTLTGLFTGASIATYKGLPLPRTTLSIAASFALISTSCLIPERIAYNSSFYFIQKAKSKNEVDDYDSKNNVSVDDNGNELRSYFQDVERNRLFASHICGGIIGGTISGSLFQKRLSLNGMFLFTPIMIGIAFAELYLQDYRVQRLKEIHSYER